MENLPADLDPLSAVALRRLNSYRIATGLAPYRYDPDLTGMAMAHVRYAMASSRANRAWSGHFEVQGQAGYSEQGNEAASTSGLAYGVRDPLAALEGLISGPYHRLQFLRPVDTRFGVGFGTWEGQNNSIGLFVTRPPTVPSTSRSGAPRFLLFPPPDSREIGALFESENPDPRPGYGSRESSEKPATGYPITISLTPDDARSFQSVDARVVDADGAPVECWVTDPVHPSNTQAPPIYAKGVSNDRGYARNFDTVFIMPKAPLQRGRTYQVQATLHIGSEYLDVKWSFATAPSYVWNIASKPTQPWRSIGYALANASEGDTVQLEAGTYDLSDAVDLSRVRLVGAGPKVTRLRFPDFPNDTPIETAGAVAIEQLSIESPTQLIYLHSGSTLLLRNVAFAGGNGRMVAIGLERGSTLVAEGLDASQFNASYLCYSLEEGKGGLPRVYWHQVAGAGVGAGLVYGSADLHGLDRAVSLP